MKMTSTFTTLSSGNLLPKVENPMAVTSGTHTMNNMSQYKLFEKPRGREKGHGEAHVKNEFGNTSPGGEGTGGEASSSPDEEGPSRKRRRSRKGLDKKFECPQEGCGKTYSRAEHLNRHQLNHNATKIFHCDHAGCERSFVRQDLCNRHKERHHQKTKGSLLGRKDSTMYNPSSTIIANNSKNPRRSLSPEAFKREDSRSKEQFTSPREKTSAPFSPTSTSFTETGDTPTSGYFPRSNSDQNISHRNDLPPRPAYSIAGHSGLKADLNSHEHHANFSNGHPPTSHGGFMSSPPRPEAGRYGIGLDGMQSLSQASPFLNGISYNPNNPTMHHNIPRRTTESNFPQQNYNPMPFMLANGHPSQPQNINTAYAIPPSNQPVPQPVPENFQNDPASHEWGVGVGVPQFVHMSQQFMPFLSAEALEGYDRSPNAAMGIDFYNYLFTEPDGSFSLDGSMGGSTSMPAGTYSSIPAQLQHHQWEPHLGQYIPPRTMAVDTILQPKLPDQRISDYRAEEIFQLISTRFNECEESAIVPLKGELLGGDRKDEQHMLSTTKMRLYIECFFEQFHPQIPFLHQPTFNADKTPNLLLIAIMAIGASCLDRRHDYDLSQRAASLSNFLAWHLRGELFNHKDFRPPGTLWMFQALLLLELYEKMYSNRLLHERAHLHHATTITLMRRGRSLLTVADTTGNQSPSRGDDPRPRSPVTEDKWWNDFIEAQSTYRAAYVAFLIDSSHAEMFGHSSVMLVTELALPLPCDEKIWSAPNGREAYRIYLNLKANVTTRPFLESIIGLIRGKQVDTDTFGRTVLMAGLLGILWAMTQRDHQLERLGVTAALGSLNKNWKANLEKAVDTWSTQFHQSLPKSFTRPYYHKEELVSESRTVLYHLAHMSMHVDVVECQIYACASRLLSRSIFPSERDSVSKKWHKRIYDKDLQTSVYYAFSFLRSVLMPDERTKQSQAYGNKTQQYRARDDPLLNRPWVLYFATLIVWCYGFAKEGLVNNGQGRRATPFDERIIDDSRANREMREYLDRFHLVGASKLDYLADMSGLNGNSGLLMVVSSCFVDCRWELLKEAQRLLSNCIRLNEGSLLLVNGNILPHEGDNYSAEGKQLSGNRRASAMSH